MTSGVIVRTMCMKFQQDGSSVSLELRSGIHVGVMAKCLLSTKKKKVNLRNYYVLCRKTVVCQSIDEIFRWRASHIH